MYTYYLMGNDILEKLFDAKILAVLRQFFQHDNKEFYIRELSKLSKVPLASTFRIVRKLVDYNIIREVKLSKFKVYVLDDNEQSRFLGQIVKKEKQALQVFVTKIKNLPNLRKIYIQGKEEKNSANVILIGEELYQPEIKQVCADIKAEFNYIVSPLSLDEDQFLQMQKMYPIKKKLLFEK